MKIVLKTKNLNLIEFHKKYFGGNGILIPVNLEINKKTLSQMIYVLDENFNGIPKDTSLTWTYTVHPYQGKYISCIVIPLKHNITT